MTGRSIHRLGLGLLAVLLISASAPQPASAAPASGKKVERTVRALFDEYPLRGTVYGVWENGRQLAVDALGQAKPGVPATTEDHFRIGNITESMTVTVLLQLVDEGKLSLADPISNWFPELPNAQNVTVGMLARSTSGYAHYGAAPTFAKSVYADPFRRWKVSELYALAFSLPPLFEPGTSWAFSDTNFLILGQLLQVVGGERVQMLLRTRIWDELGLEGTAMQVGAHIDPPVLHGFTRARDNKYQDSTGWSPSTFRGAGNGTSTIGDLGIWARALGTGRLVSPASHALQVGPQNVGLDAQTEERHYAMGSGVTNGWIYNNPNLSGYKGQLAYLPAKGIAIVVFSTDGPAAKPSVRYDADILNRIAAIVAPKQPPNQPFCLDPPCS